MLQPDGRGSDPRVVPRPRFSRKRDRPENAGLRNSVGLLCRPRSAFKNGLGHQLDAATSLRFLRLFNAFAETFSLLFAEAHASWNSG